MLDNLRFWTSDKLNEYEKEDCNLLAMNVELFTSISKNLHGHNFRSLWCYHLDSKVASGGCEIEIDELKENPTRLLIVVWFDCGGSCSSARVLRV